MGDDYWSFIENLDGDQKKDVLALKEKFERFNGKLTAKRSLNGRNLAFTTGSVANKYFDFNGLSSDLSHYYKKVESVGNNGLYWYTSDDCIHHKSCDVYPVHRVLDKSKQISCNEILTEILPSIYECVKERGKKCSNVIDSGYYRVIMKTVYAKTGEEIVIKMMKSKSIKKERDLIRHIRESILLGLLYDLEQEYISDDANNDKLFTQTLNNGKVTKKVWAYAQQ